MVDNKDIAIESQKLDRDKKELMIVSNPIERDKKPPVGMLAFQKQNTSKREASSEAVNVLFMDETGIDRNSRRSEILNYFPDNSADGAKTVETIVNRTTGFNQKQLCSLLTCIRLKDFRNSTEFLYSLDENITKVWMEET